MREKKEWKLLLVFIIVFVVLCICVYFYFKDTTKSVKKNDEIISVIAKNDESVSNDSFEWMVDLKGEVVNPGTYKVNSGMRIIDVVALGGGLKSNADVSILNLSQKIVDQMVIIIYSIDEVKDMKNTKKIEEYIYSLCKELNITQNDACISKDEDDLVNQNNEKISINKATLEELMTLTGIGESKAQAIIEYRKKTPFTNFEDLMNVSGIGESVLNDIKDKISL